ncbi:transglycosylase protein with SLT domain [Halopolyspora algeriensis]|uniref:Transglycosylase protein with SLT domain n=1 Tax=Halopolyspora algeriensis TaxID=1500506 RepID=A0A368VFH5_9ACTN|nr:lytic murein transglycosylase [Halopolyspora algeriensis]RCW39973.1 transglycosylase protein with SLT domain [Halopolyspora algeriensis]TQM46590.1 transglycosylase protein with SLT domain [Halopolyspora algeriensis]
MLVSQQPAGPGLRPGPVLGLVALVVLVLVVWSAVTGPVDESPSGVPADLPTAAAPPDPGAEPPNIRVFPPEQAEDSPEGRPQRQLEGWAAPLSEELDIPEPALEAYGYAASVLETTRPDCGLSWSVLAGIGAVESRHGRYGGAELDRTGRPSTPIRGLPLDGRDGVKLIRDTDNGTLDGDTTYDRAVGPLQFIPTTWEKWGVDADGDGVADPDDIDDAAMAAGDYLCASGGHLRDADRFWDALLTYNASRSYGQDVLDRADHYGRKSHRLSAKR